MASTKPQKFSFLINKRFILTVLMIIGVAGYFWSQSRYPQLDEKMMMGADTHVEAIGFDVLVAMPEAPSIFEKIYVNSANWMWTNRKGMAFGLILGALMMNLLPFLQGLQLRSGFANSGLGILMGAPLGLCVNCSTPVAHGLHESGARTETMLAAMMSSPTLNVIVLTMLFAMFPPWLAFMKIGITLLFILAVIPILTRFLKPKFSSIKNFDLEMINVASEKQIKDPNCEEIPEDCVDTDKNENILQAGIWVFRGFFINLWYLVKITVPLMILAGILGAIIVSFVPIDQMVRYLPEGRIFSWVSMLALALFGLLLPSPMTFDIIVSAILYNAGVPIKYVAILLFTLGIFSIYPFMTLWRRLSREIAFGLAGVLIIFGVSFGVVANRYQMWDTVQQQKHILEPFMAIAKPPRLNKIDRANQGIRANDLLPQLKETSLTSELFFEGGNISAERIPFIPQTSLQKSQTLMQRFDQEEFGISEHDNVSLYKLEYRHSVSRGVATGDVNRDGWTDFAVSSDAGMALYLNKSGKKFIQQRIEISRFDEKLIVGVALVDLNNDGWLDIWLNTLEEGNFVIYSREGDFLADNMIPVENQPDALVTGSTGFADIDRDGNLDIVLGNVSFDGKSTDAKVVKSVRNVWLRQTENNGFAVRNLPGAGGESLTNLISDIDGDNDLDILVGNDLMPPDTISLGDGNGSLRPIKKSEGIIPHTTDFTMSISSADIDNDLKPEIFFGSVSRESGPGEIGSTKLVSPKEICAEINNRDERDNCERVYAFREIAAPAIARSEFWNCNKLDKEGREACIAMGIIQMASHSTKDETLCTLPPGWGYLERVCRRRFSQTFEVLKDEASEYIPQVNKINVLLKQNESGKFDDKALEFGLDKSGWTWNAKFADLDNDGWQDLYVVSGWISRINTESNFFFKNMEGKRFENITGKSGLASSLNTLSYSYLDIDNDGDLDIIAAPTFGPLAVYINRSDSNRSIAFELNDKQGNFYGIGSKIIINYGDGKNQMREIQSSGGYLSFDAPIAYFGLGVEESVTSVEVVWSTGERTIIDKEFKAGARYKLNRTR